MKARLSVVIRVLVIASPYILYGIAQTSKIHPAVESGDLQSVRNSIKPWKSLDAQNRNGNTPLALAIEKGNLPIARLLLDRGATIQFKTSLGKSVDHLSQALSWNKPEIVALLLDRGVALESGAAMQAAVNRQDHQILKMLLKQSKTRDVVALDRAVQLGDLQAVELLLTHGTPVNALTPQSHSPMFSAVSLSPTVPQRLEIASLLIKHGAQLNVTTSDYKTLFFVPLPRGDLEMLELLIKNGYPFKAREGSSGYTALYYAARVKKKEVVQLLLQYGADANDGGIECLRLVEECESMGGIRTALHEAIDLTRSGKSQMLVSSEIVKLLLQFGAKINVQDRGGNTPLFTAIYTDNWMAAEQLLKAGADWRIGSKGHKPIDIARSKEGRSGFIEMLSAYGAK